MIKLIVFDIDGVLTDGNVMVDESGKEYKSYNLTEIDAVTALKRDGCLIAAITGEATPITNIFAKRIPWDEFIVGCKDKLSAVKNLESKFNLHADEICYIGDGKYDIEPIKYVGLGVCPSNAINEVKLVADHVLDGLGGKDCIKELAKLLKNSQPSVVSHVLKSPTTPPPCLNSLDKDFKTAADRFNIDGRVCIITGGAGLMGVNHAEAILSGGGTAVLLDISTEALEAKQKFLSDKFPAGKVLIYLSDITERSSLEKIRDDLMKTQGRIDVLINNAANNPKMEKSTANMGAMTFSDFPMSLWNADISVGLTGALLCSQVFGQVMADSGKGVILNISSDLGVIAPDQRIYRKEGLREEEQIKKPVTYSVIKHGLIGLTKYIATYWADKGVRCNAICPGGIENGQDQKFIEKLTSLIPMGRMASKDEYQSTVLYMISDASAYMTGTSVIIDGGRTCW